MQILQPPGWPRPRGYANAVTAEGRLVFVAGQIGWDATGRVVSDDLVEQVRQTLENTLAVLREAGAVPQHVARMTWYVTDKREYLARAPELGEVYRALMGRHYPAMAVVEVKALIEDRAKVEIETTAVVPT
jgi:enamine deaminase RidA (YjgF/YER057c/UK114 family)